MPGLADTSRSESGVSLGLAQSFGEVPAINPSSSRMKDRRIIEGFSILPPKPMEHSVFITGATGHMGRALLPALRARGHTVRALVRPGSAGRLPAGTDMCEGNPLAAASFQAAIAPADTLV